MENKIFKINTETDKYLYRWITLKNKISWTVLIIFALFFLYMIYMPFVMHLISKYYLSPELNNFAADYTKNISNDMERLETLFKWQRNQFKAIYGYTNLDVLPFLWHNKYNLRICMRTDRDNDPSWTFLSKCGACGESALLYGELVKAAGFNVKIIKDSGEDHSWVEVYINNTWKPIDPSWEGGFNTTRNSLGYQRNVSYIYAITSTSLHEVLTEIYTNKTGKLIINLNRSIEDPNIILLSKSLDANRETGAICEWNDNSCTLSIGERDYILLVYGGGIIKKYEKKEFSIKTGEIVNLYFNPEKIYFPVCSKNKICATIILFFFTFLMWIMTGLFLGIIKHIPKKSANRNLNRQNS